MQPSFPALLVVALGATACAVTQETTPAKVELDDTIARSQASALSLAVENAQADDGVAIAQAVASIGDAAVALIPQANGGARQRVARAGASTTCVCAKASKSCTFNGCRFGDATITGLLSWSGGTIRCSDLAVAIAATSSSVGVAHVSIDCAISYAPGELSGTLHTIGDAVVENVTYGWDATIAASDVTFRSDRFLGGSVDVRAAVTTSSESSGDRSFDGSAVVSLP